MKTVKLSLLIGLFSLVSYTLFSQTDIPEGRYVSFTNEAEVFILNDGNIEARSMVLCNIFEDESSKPAHIAVNELSNVINFGIKSKSGQFANNRSCYVIMESKNYLNTFKLVLDKMNVEQVLYNEEFISIDRFCTIFNNK